MEPKLEQVVETVVLAGDLREFIWDDKMFRRRSQQKGVAYSLEQFAAKYDLNEERAEDLYYRFGPSSVELDLLMAAKDARRQELPFVGEPTSRALRSVISPISGLDG